MSIFWRSWGDFRHPSEETLLLYLDGELGPARHRQITAHLQNCWNCRSRRDRIEQTIGAIVDCENAHDAQLAPPNAWRTFESRLHALATAQPAPGIWARFAAQASPLRYALASATLFALLIWTYFSAGPSVSAQEFLARAGAAEASRTASLGSNRGFQRLRIRLTAAHGSIDHFATIAYGAGGEASGDEVWQNLDRILRRNGMERALSARAHERWRNKVPHRSESVRRTRLEDGTDAIALATESALPHRPDTIVESTLVVRAGDWRPVEQNLTVQSEHDTVRYDLTEVAFDVRPPELPRITAIPAPALEPTPAPQPPAPVFQADLEAVEIEVRYTLHHLRACLGEPVEVARDGSGHVVVRGLAENAARKAELADALQKIPWALVEIRTPEEAAVAHSTPEAPLRPYADVEPQSSALPIQKQLEAYFKQHGGAGAVSDRIVGLTTQASSLGQTLMAETWALRHLLEQYPAERAAQLQPAFARLLEEMIADHAATIHDRASECRALVEPVLITLVPTPLPAREPSTAEPAAAALFAASRDAERFSLLLFTGSNEANVLPEEAAARLLNSLSDVEFHSRIVAQEFRRGLSAAAKDGSPQRR